MILSIESSCDDSSIAITRIADKALLFHQKISQDAQHMPYGGVVPELASRLHAVALPKILDSCAEYLEHVKAVAVTYTPGLSITLLEGLGMAQALCLFLHVPLIGVHHLKGHVYSLFIEQESFFPLDVLLVSGGHTLIIEATQAQMRILAKSMDDSFGESFDKVAKMLQLGYPGGPIVESLAQKGDPYRFSISVPLAYRKDIAFSFSGLKNAVRLIITSLQEKQILSTQDKADVCACFQRVAVTHLVQQCAKFLQQSTRKDFAIVGGASANLHLRESLNTLLTDRNLRLAPLEFCADNAAMIGRVGVDMYQAKDFTPLTDITPIPRTLDIF